MEIKSVSIKNFKKITAVTLPIGTVNILVGENSSGKSSILQAVHLAACAIRQASEVRTDRSVTIPITEIEYIPTNIYRKLGKGREWGNTDTQPETRVEFEFSDKESKASAYCRLKSARNSAGISIKGNIPSNLQQSLRRRNSFFTAYIPGLAGIPNAENYLPRRSIDKISASGESNSAFRNILLRLNQSDKAYYKEIINHLKELIGDIDIRTNFNERTDLQIECNAWISGREIPIELLGSGHLKLIHILSYLYFYKTSKQCSSQSHMAVSP